jgi:molybdopterin-binding protein
MSFCHSHQCRYISQDRSIALARRVRDRRIWFDRRPSIKLSARNQLSKIVAVTKGQTTAHVRIDIGGGVIVTSSITNEAVDDLGLKVGDEALAVIKASDVMVAK